MARTNFLPQEMCDLPFAPKDCSRWMSNPSIGDWALMERVGRYLIGMLRVVNKFCWQDKPAELSVFSDSNWAGWRETWERRCVHSWSSSNQAVQSDPIKQQLEFG